MTEEYKPKITQGHEKLALYIQKLIRNEVFLELLNKLEKTKGKWDIPGTVETWTKEEKEMNDYFNKELSGVMNDYEELKKRCKRLMEDKRQEILEQINYEYGLDFQLLNYLKSVQKKDSMVSYYEDYVEMCRVENQYDEELLELDPIDSFTHLRYDKISKLMAYPISINIHTMASKRDVLDFIEKRWKWIDSLLRYSEESILKIKRKKKYSQELLDFVWENRKLSANLIKIGLDEKFPKNGLIYYEISKLIQIQKHERLEE